MQVREAKFSPTGLTSLAISFVRQVAFAKSLKTVFAELAAYVQEYHPNGLQVGGEAESTAAAGV